MTWIKGSIRHVIAIVGYYFGLDALFYRLNRHCKRVVTFHNVLPDSLYCQAPVSGPIDKQSDFEAIVREISKRFKFSVDLEDSSTVTLSFDDGYVNQVEVAGEVLSKMQIPAILFVAGDVVDSTHKEALPIDLLGLWVDNAPEEKLAELVGYPISRYDAWSKVVKADFLKDGHFRGRSVLRRLDELYSFDSILAALPAEWVRLRMTGVTSQQLDELRHSGWIVGWHSKSHFPLGLLSPEEIKDELMSPLEYRTFPMSYPYGLIGAVGDETIRIASQLGYPIAFSNDPDYSEFRGRYFQMRFLPMTNRFELHFRLSGFKYFLQSFRLLPRS